MQALFPVDNRQSLADGPGGHSAPLHRRRQLDKYKAMKTKLVQFVQPETAELHASSWGVFCMSEALFVVGNILEVDGGSLQLDLELPRRRLQVSFTCNKCGETDSRTILSWLVPSGSLC